MSVRCVMDAARCRLNRAGCVGGPADNGRVAELSTHEQDGALIAALEDIARIMASGGTLVLSGAGLSTESGIPDYRGPDGTRRVKPMEYGEFVATSAARQRYWARAYVGWQRFAASRPNVGHDVVAALQAAGVVRGIITQNVDGLHQQAGARDVVELHGTLSRVVCLTCRAEVDRDALQRELAALNPTFGAHTDEVRPDGDVALAQQEVDRFVIARCSSCGADTLKPDVVFFGESVPKERVERCYALTQAARSVLVLGSSLQVMSGLRFVRRAHALGTPVAVITRGPTRATVEISRQADAALGQALPILAELLGVPVPPGRSALVAADGLPLGLM